MFDEINKIAQNYGCIFTLYVDDMTFSSTIPFVYKKLARDIDIILRKYGHKPKYRKIKFYSKKDSKPITGTIITRNHNLEIPNSLQKKVYDNFQEFKKINVNDDSSIDEKKKVLSLKGQLQSAKNIDSSRFPEINRLVVSGANKLTRKR